MIAFAFGLSFIFFKALNAVGLLRSDPHHEITGLDMPEMGAPGYSNVDIRMPGGRLRPQRPIVNGARL